VIFPQLRMLIGQSVQTEFYSSKVLNSDWNMTQSPSAIYVASLNKTFVCWCAVGRAGDKASQVASFDHATSTWSRRYNAGNYTLADDDHGHPAIVRDAAGYFHIFYGSHDSDQHWSSTNNPDDITSWTQHAPMSGDQTYPHPVLIGSTIYLFLRNGDTFPNNATMSVRTCTPALGVGTFSGQSNLINFDSAGSGGRVYTGECHVVGTDVHFVCTRSDEVDSIRSGIYYFVYKSATGAIENHDGSFSTASGSLPITLASANTNYRLINFGTDGGEVPSLAFDSSGNPHVQYIQGTTGAFTLRHISKSAGVWSAPTTVATITDQVPGTGAGQGFVDIHGLVAGAAGTMQSWYQNNAGDKLRRVRSSGGVWSAQETIVTAGSFRLMGQQAVRGAHANLRSIFSEVSSSSTDAGSIAGKRYMHGDGGLLTPTMPAAGSVDPQWPNVPIMLGFDHRDGSARIINESDSGAVVTALGTAQADTAQSKFGNASLLLNGGNAHLTLEHDSLFSVSNGDFTLDAWVKRNSSKLHCIASKNPAVGSSEWRCFIDASNHVLFQAFNATVAVVNIAGTTTVTTGWHHVRFVRSGTLWLAFLDGNLEASATQSAAPTSNTLDLNIGRDQSNLTRDFVGWIDDLRFTAGHARSTASFTAPTAAFPRI
jgi:hypothetical protein